MTQPIGGLPPNILNLTMMMPAALQAYGTNFQRIDPSIGFIARDALNQIGVFPIPPVPSPGEGDLGRPGSGADEHLEVGDKPPPAGAEEGHRYLPLLPKNMMEGTFRGIQEVPIKMEKDFKGDVLKVAEKLLPDQKGKSETINTGVEKVAEVVEGKSSQVLDQLSQPKEPSAAHSMKVISQAQEGGVKTPQMDLVVEMKIPDASSTGKQPTDSAHANRDVVSAKLSPDSAAKLMLVTPPQGLDSSPIPDFNLQGNLLALVNTSLIPIQTSLTKEGAQAIAQANSEHVHHDVHENHHSLHIQELSIPSPTDLQGLTIALTLPLGLLPILPSQLVGAAESLRIGKEDHAIGGVVHRSLHHEKPPPLAATDNTPIVIPSTNPNLHRIPDGREISYIAQMAQMGLYRGKKVDEGKFRLPDGLKLDPGFRLGDLLTISYFASLCGAASLTQIGAFVDEHEAWVVSNFDMRRGLPSPLVFMWLFSRIKPYYFTKIVLQHIEYITDRKKGRSSPFNAIRIWDTNQGLIFGHSREETRAPSQSQILRIFDWAEATLIMEPAKNPEEVRKDVFCKLLLSVSPENKELLLQDASPITTKTEEWNDAYDAVSSLELALYPNWTVGQYTRVQEGVLKLKRTYFSNLPLEFSAWNSLFYPRSDLEEQTVWLGEGRFLSGGEVTISHAMDNFDLLRQVAYKNVLESTTLTGSVEEKRRKFWEDPDEMLIMIHY